MHIGQYENLCGNPEIFTVLKEIASTDDYEMQFRMGEALLEDINLAFLTERGVVMNYPDIEDITCAYRQFDPEISELMSEVKFICRLRDQNGVLCHMPHMLLGVVDTIYGELVGKFGFTGQAAKQ